jgi:cytochrome c5
MPVFVRILAVVAVTLPLPQAVFGSSGADVYRTRCALCHDSGATQAPRVGQPNDWRQRVQKGRAALLRSALEGVRDTAMLPRAGFADLGDADVASAVDYMLSTLKLSIPETGKDTLTAKPANPASKARVSAASPWKRATGASRCAAWWTALGSSAPPRTRRAAFRALSQSRTA